MWPLERTRAPTPGTVALHPVTREYDSLRRQGLSPGVGTEMCRMPIAEVRMEPPWWDSQEGHGPTSVSRSSHGPPRSGARAHPPAEDLAGDLSQTCALRDFRDFGNRTLFSVADRKSTRLNSSH